VRQRRVTDGYRFAFDCSMGPPTQQKRGACPSGGHGYCFGSLLLLPLAPSPPDFPLLARMSSGEPWRLPPRLQIGDRPDSASCPTLLILRNRPRTGPGQVQDRPLSQQLPSLPWVAGRPAAAGPSLLFGAPNRTGTGHQQVRNRRPRHESFSPAIVLRQSSAVRHSSGAKARNPPPAPPAQ
jgi:hypothetical protein